MAQNRKLQYYMVHPKDERKICWSAGCSNVTKRYVQVPSHDGKEVFLFVRGCDKHAQIPPRIEEPGKHVCDLCGINEEGIKEAEGGLGSLCPRCFEYLAVLVGTTARTNPPEGRSTSVVKLLSHAMAAIRNDARLLELAKETARGVPLEGRILLPRPPPEPAAESSSEEEENDDEAEEKDSSGEEGAPPREAEKKHKKSSSHKKRRSEDGGHHKKHRRKHRKHRSSEKEPPAQAPAPAPVPEPAPAPVNVPIPPLPEPVHQEEEEPEVVIRGPPPFHEGIRVDARDTAIAALASQLQMLQQVIQRTTAPRATFFLDEPKDDAFFIRTQRWQALKDASHLLTDHLLQLRNTMHSQISNYTEARKSTFDVQGKSQMLVAMELKLEQALDHAMRQVDASFEIERDAMDTTFAGIVSSREMVEDIVGTKGIIKACVDCRAAHADTVNVPCGHVMYCTRCAKTKTTICRKEGCGVQVKSRLPLLL